MNAREIMVGKILFQILQMPDIVILLLWVDGPLYIEKDLIFNKVGPLVH